MKKQSQFEGEKQSGPITAENLAFPIIWRTNVPDCTRLYAVNSTEIGGNQMSEVYTVSIKAAVQFSSLSANTLYRLIKQKKIKTAKIGKSRRIYMESLKKFLDKSEQKV